MTSATKPAPEPIWETGCVTLSGTRLRVAQRGEGPPLLLLMGIGGNLDMWRPVASLVTGRRLIAFDAPGTGGSGIGHLRRMSGLADLTAKLLDELDYPAVDVLGYSFGGALAQELAHRHPWRVRRLVLGATMCGLGGVPARPSVYWHMAHPLRYHSERYLRWISPRLYGGRARSAAAGGEDRLRERLGSPPGWLGYLSQLAAISGWSSLPWLHRLRAPTLVLAGDDDPLVPLANARLLRCQIPGARLHVIRGGGHLFLLDQTEAVVAEIQAFLGEAAEDL